MRKIFNCLYSSLISPNSCPGNWKIVAGVPQVCGSVAMCLAGGALVQHPGRILSPSFWYRKCKHSVHAPTRGLIVINLITFISSSVNINGYETWGSWSNLLRRLSVSNLLGFYEVALNFAYINSIVAHIDSTPPSTMGKSRLFWET